jgi:hypothetical protein
VVPTAIGRPVCPGKDTEQGAAPDSHTLGVLYCPHRVSSVFGHFALWVVSCPSVRAANLESEDWQGPIQSLGRLHRMAEVAGPRHLAELNEWHERNSGASDFHERWERFLGSLHRRPAEPGTARDGAT